mmetsp:Transcript_98247/g.174095  ORF Transcript_98247/g.174095 Transcript_98247/m.174095 type:complete len:277 (-) Transcript_98247:526-1356(-)
MGLQHLISQHGESSIPLMSDTQFLTLKVQMKLTDAAHEKGLILSGFLLESIRALSTRHGLMAATDPSGAVRSAGNKPETFHVSNGHSSSNPDSALFGSDTDSSSARTSFTFPPTSPSLAQVHSDNGAKDVSPEAIGDEVLFNATHTAKVSRIVHDAPRENVRTLYHATRESNALSMCRMKQFLPGRNGFLGAGIYFCEDDKKARRYCQCRTGTGPEVVLRCQVSMGKIKTVFRGPHTAQELLRDGCESFKEYGRDCFMIPNNDNNQICMDSIVIEH